MFEMLVALDVADDNNYAKYRQAMKPILNQFGGAFGYDFTIEQVLLSQVDEAINRVFTINFPDRQAMEAFFADEEYLAVKSEFFSNSVNSTTIIASYEK
ncbi:DUF1330 domain-containing protein [Litorilituus sediminis]|uniref:DUF1330 domain-containing protein n=1 Tax=Litorilituus sediminis TaxID=718192 RepID=A0A4P6P6D0_9GAMM|nr:DUF1330 domain-containing protein [Litorilituus sediminis]QBG37161.1 DUF1330 domain-containing protein [Litorilituus sediminis]